MKNFFKPHIQICISFFGILLLGTFGYFFIEKNWTLFESFYMTAITITTVGYRETRPLSEAGRVFTVFLIFTGLGTAALFATQLAKTFLENNFKEIVGANKMKKKIDSLNNHFIVCGFGDIGSSICSVLAETKIPFVVIESDPEIAEYAKQRQILTVKGKATYDTTLMQARINNAMGIVICLGDDSLNMHVSLAARDINPDIYIIARGYKSHIEKRMVRAGANTVVNPLKLGGEQIADLIVNQYKKENKTESIMLHQSAVMGYALRMYQHFQTEPVSISQMKNKFNALVALKLRRTDGSEIHNPDDDEMVSNHETVLFLIDQEADKIPSSSENEKKYKLFVWSDDYSVGIRSIDEEHQRLFELSNEFIDAVNRGHGKDVLSETFGQLIEYTSSHFSTEEKLFEIYDYPEKQQHMEEHKNLVSKVLDLNRNKTYIFDINVADFLYSWLMDHILETDMRYSKFLQDKGVR